MIRASMLYKQMKQGFTRIITTRVVCSGGAPEPFHPDAELLAEELPGISEYKQVRCPVCGKTGYLNRDWEEVPEEVVYGKVS